MTSYAAERAKLLLGCYRTGEANDPATYVAAVTVVLARYPEDVITTVTHPATGLPKKINWLPTIKEVSDACEEANGFNVRNEARLRQMKEQLEAREADAIGERPTLAELKAKYGPNWGIEDQVAKIKEDPARIAANLAATDALLVREYGEVGLKPIIQKNGRPISLHLARILGLPIERIISEEAA